MLRKSSESVLENVLSHTVGLTSFKRTTDTLIMPAAHRHNEFELNFIVEGNLTYMLGGRRISMPADSLAAFWGAVPHLIVDVSGHLTFYALHVPLAWFLRWHLPDRFVRRILHGELGRETDAARLSFDPQLFAQWDADLGSGSVKARRIVLLELEARLHRLAETAEYLGEKTGLNFEMHGHVRDDELGKVEAMASYISDNYTNPLTVVEVAESVGLNPNYATTLFRKKAGISLKQCIITSRLNHAQLLLATTDHNVLDVAMQSGFGSASQFHSAFRANCGMPPGEYREQIRSLK